MVLRALWPDSISLRHDSLREYEGIKNLHETACFIAEYLDFGGELLNHSGGDWEEARIAAEDKYCGCYKLLTDYAQELTKETTQIPEHLAYYINYERMAGIWGLAVIFYHRNWL